MSRVWPGLWYGAQPLVLSRQLAEPEAFLVEGRGPRVRDASGRWYLDMRAGLWNVTLGYDHQALRAAIADQLEALPAGQMLRFDEIPQVTAEYADALLDHLPGGPRLVRLYQSGAQAVEGAILLARFLRHLGGTPDRSYVVALRHGWHGTGAAAGAATGEDLLHEACGALLPGVVHVDPPYCYRCPWSLKYPSCGLRCAEAVGEKIEELGPARVTAVLAEPLMGARIVDPPDDYLRTLRELCDRHGIFLIVDEITTGFGRTGALTRCEQLGVLPDMLLLGKGITGGYVPLSALVLWERVEELLLDTRSPYGFPHGSTSDGHPLAAAAGMAVLEILDKEGVLTNVRIAGERLQVALRSLADAHPAIGDVRGRGLMLGVELVEPDGSPWPEARMNALRLLCMEEGLLVHTSHNVLDLMPPLILDERDCQEVAECLERALTGLQQLGWGS